MRHNLLRERLDAGLGTLGTHILSAWPTLIELIGQAGGYDYVEFTAEYAPFDLHDLDNLGRALEVAGLCGMMKLEQTQWTHQAMRAIGSGFQSLLFADVRTVDDAVACVRATRAETPTGLGRLGVGMRRDVGTIREAGSPAYVKALDDVVVAIMVEKRECVEDIDAILSVEGPRHGPVRAGRLRDEHRPRRPVRASRCGRGGAPDDRDRAPQGSAPARRAVGSCPRGGLYRYGRPPLLHRMGRVDPARMVADPGRRDAGAHGGAGANGPVDDETPARGQGSAIGTLSLTRPDR
ncbi:MAG: hypothetical protein IPK81_16045 [Rhodospirillales bacterium]|nr:MAG: hypothetical protein IPK81_16045 [Rhodospirillales bacterium]